MSFLDFPSFQPSATTRTPSQEYDESKQWKRFNGRFQYAVDWKLSEFRFEGDRVGLNQMLREGASLNVQDYDNRTALHLAASEGHASIVELLLHYKADVNLDDRWHRTMQGFTGIETYAGSLKSREARIL